MTKSLKIGNLIARNLVSDGACLQMGIGSIPDAVLAGLGQHKDLGIHTEMFSDGVLPLVEEGVITNSKKVQHRGAIVTSFAVGSNKLYDFVDNNPGMYSYIVFAIFFFFQKFGFSTQVGLTMSQLFHPIQT